MTGFLVCVIFIETFVFLCPFFLVVNVRTVKLEGFVKCV